MHVLGTTLDTYPPQAPLGIGIPPLGARTHTALAAGLQQVRTTYGWNGGGPSFAGEVAARYIYMNAHAPVSLDVTFATITYVECPSTSGTFYIVLDVQDIDKGLSTEQRRLAVQPQLFPSPLP